MSQHPPPRPRRRLAAFAAASLALATVATTLGGTPAGAALAPLSTTDAVGIRVDENAINGPVLELIETELQPFVDQMVREGAEDSSPVSNPDEIRIQSNLELGFDVLAPAAGRPDGGIAVNASIQGIRIEFRKDAWWHSECGIVVQPYNATINASANVNRSRLPQAPLTINPITADWDDDPSVSTSGVCWTYLIDDFFNGFFGSGEEGSIADNIEEQLNGEAQALVDDLWADHVVPVIGSLAGMGITFNQIRTDTNGLIVTANVNATGGLTIPGLGGPYNVTNTEDAGVTSNVNTVLAARSEVTVTIHPNVVNQYLNAINQFLNNQLGSVAAVGSTIESLLLPAASRGLYDDNLWTVSAEVQAPYYTKPTGTGGRPQMQIPQLTLTVRHPDYDFGFSPVAVFSGSMSGINLSTEVRPGTSNFGPSLNPSAATVSLTTNTGQTPAEVLGHMSATGFSTNSMLPYAKGIVDFYNDDLFVGYLSLAPINIGGISVTLCTTCTRVSGDQRYTEFLNVA
jgi:hypothetical protein